jgi:hypothetical protein
MLHRYQDRMSQRETLRPKLYNEFARLPDRSMRTSRSCPLRFKPRAILRYKRTAG